MNEIRGRESVFMPSGKEENWQRELERARTVQGSLKKRQEKSSHTSSYDIRK